MQDNTLSGNKGERGRFCGAHRGNGGKESDVQSPGAFWDVYGTDAVFPLSVPMGAYPAAQGGMVYGQASANGMNNGNAVMGGAVSPSVSNPADMEAAMQNAGDVQEEAVSENPTEPPDNDLIDFDAF